MLYFNLNVNGIDVFLKVKRMYEIASSNVRTLP